MTLLRTPAPTEATGRTAEIFQQAQNTFGHLSTAMQLYALSPAALDNQWQFIRYYMQHPTLSFALLAMIRLLVSQDNHCPYCITLNTRLLMERAGLSPEQLAASRDNPDNAPLTEKERALLKLVLRATRNTGDIKAQDIDTLHALGWNDADILDAVLHGARNVAADIVFNTFQVTSD